MTGRRRHAVRLALGSADIVSAVAACCGAYALRFGTGLLPIEGRTDVLPARYLAALPAAVLLLVLATAFAGLYEDRRATTRANVADRLRLAATATATLATVALLYWSEFQYSRSTLVLTAGAYAGLCPLLRRGALHLVERLGRPGAGGEALVIGGGGPATALERALRQERGAPSRVTAVLPVGPGQAFPHAERMSAATDALRALESGRFAEVFVALPAASAADAPEWLLRLEQSAVDVHLVPDLGGATLLNPGSTFVDGFPIVTLRERPLYGLRAATKRAMDAGFAALLLIAATPALLLIGLLVRVTSRGPVLFVQERMGLDGKPFRMLKFRTMCDGAEDGSGPVFARRADPRATPIGRVLRRFSLDELPQLWNVLRGEMSLVGPRPERGPFIEEFRRRVPGYMLRHAVKAGMTGWAQVHGLRGETSIEERLRYDLEYVDRWSLSLDVEILARTALHVLAGRNAY